MVWAEAWALPHLGLTGYAAKKIAYLPTTETTWGVHSDVWREEGSASLPATFNRLDEILYIDPDDHTNDEGSIIKLFDEDYVGADTYPKPFFEFVVQRRARPLASKVNSQVQLAGKGLIAYYFEGVGLKPYDYFLYDFPSDYKSYEDDWIWGGDSIIDNGNMEESVELNEVQSVWIAEQELTPDATPTFTLTLNGETSAALDHDMSTTDMEAALNTAWTGIDSLQVTGTGSETDPWEIEFLVPTGVTQNLVTINLGGLNQQTGEVARVQLGGTLGPVNWEQSVHTISGVPYGYYEVDGIAIVDSSVTAPHSGLYSLMVNGRAEPYNTPGVQQIVSVKQGHRYEAGVWIKTADHTSTGLFRMVMRDPNSSGGVATLFNETFIAKVEQLITSSDTWVFFPLSFFVPIGVTELVMRIAWVGAGSGDPAPFFIDDAFLSPGAPAATWGAIWLELLVDAQSDHTAQGRQILDWLVPTFTAVLDSGGNAWDAERSITFTVDSTYDQMAEEGQNLWGYVHRIRFDETDGLYKLDIFNPGGGGVNRPAISSTGALAVGMNVIGGEFVQNSPIASHWRVTGGDNLWDEGRDTSLETAWGQREGVINEPDIRYDPTDGFIDIINQQFTRTESAMLGIEFETTKGLQSQPFVNYNVYDIVRAIPGTETGIAAIDRYVTSIVGRADGTGIPVNQVHISSDVFASSGTAALTEGVRRLLRLRRRRPKKMDHGLPLSIRKRVPPVAGGGGVPTLVVAASDATVESIAKADFVCTGGDDGPTIQLAIDTIIAQLDMLGGEHGGEVWLTEGIFEILATSSGPRPIVVSNRITLRGMNPDGTVLLVMTNPTGAGRHIVQLLSGAKICDLSIQKLSTLTLNSDSAPHIHMAGSDCSVVNVHSVDAGGGLNFGAIQFSNSFMRGFIRDVVIITPLGTGIYVLGCQHVAIENVHIRLPGEMGIRVVSGADRVWVNNCRVDGATEDSYYFDNCLWSGVSNSFVTDSESHGIHFSNQCEGCAAVNNTLYQPGLHGIWSDNCLDTRVFGNWIEDAGFFESNLCDGINFSGSVMGGNFASHNTIRDTIANTRYGVNVESTNGRGHIYVNNRAVGTFGTAGYNDADTNTSNVWPGAAAPQGDNFLV